MNGSDVTGSDMGWGQEAFVLDHVVKFEQDGRVGIHQDARNRLETAGNTHEHAAEDLVNAVETSKTDANRHDSNSEAHQDVANISIASSSRAPEPKRGRNRGRPPGTTKVDYRRPRAEGCWWLKPELEWWRSTLKIAEGLWRSTLMLVTSWSVQPFENGPRRRCRGTPPALRQYQGRTTRYGKCARCYLHGKKCLDG